MEIYTEPYLTRFLVDNDHLRCIGTTRRSNNTLLEPGIKTLPDLSLKLNRDSSMQQVNWLIRSGGYGMFEAVTET